MVLSTSSRVLRETPKACWLHWAEVIRKRELPSDTAADSAPTDIFESMEKRTSFRTQKRPGIHPCLMVGNGGKSDSVLIGLMQGAALRSREIPTRADRKTGRCL